MMVPISEACGGDGVVIPRIEGFDGMALIADQVCLATGKTLL